MLEMLSFIQQLIILYSIALVGYAAKKFGIIDDTADKALTNIILYITLPALIVFSMDFPFSFSFLKNFYTLIFLSIYILVLACILAFFMARQNNLPEDKGGVYQSLIIFGNQGFLGYALCFSLFSKEGVMYASVFNLFFLFLIWTYGVYLIAKEQLTFSWRILILNPGVLATSFGLLLFLMPFKLPLTISKFLENLGTPTTPLSMLLIGSLIGNLKKDVLFKLCKDKHLWQAVFAKLIIVPLLPFMLIFFNIKFTLLAIAVILTAMPSAPTTAIFAKKYGSDIYFGSIGICVSTLLSLLSLPLLYWLLNILAK